MNRDICWIDAAVGHVAIMGGLRAGEWLRDEVSMIPP